MKHNSFKSIVIFLFCFLPFQAFAGSMNFWEDLSWLVAVVNGNPGNFQNKVYYGLYPQDDAETEEVAMLRAKLDRASQEFENIQEAQSAPDIDVQIAELKQQMAQMPPAYKQQIQEAIKILESQKAEYKAQMEAVIKAGFTDDPKELLKEATRLSLGGKLYYDYHDLDNGLYMANAAKPSDNNKDQWGAIDKKTGKTVIPFKYKYYGHSSEHNIIFVTMQEKGKSRAGALDYTGKETLPFKYADWKEVANYAKLAIFKGTNNLFGFIDFNKKEIFPAQFDEVRDPPEDSWEVLKKGKRGIISYEGKLTFHEW